MLIGAARLANYGRVLPRYHEPAMMAMIMYERYDDGRRSTRRRRRWQWWLSRAIKVKLKSGNLDFSPPQTQTQTQLRMVSGPSIHPSIRIHPSPSLAPDVSCRPVECNRGTLGKIWDQNQNDLYFSDKKLHKCIKSKLCLFVIYIFIKKYFTGIILF